MSSVSPYDVAQIVRNALAEDVGAGDVTSHRTLSPTLIVHARLVAKGAGVISGVTVANAVFYQLDPRVVFRTHKDDGSWVEAGDEVASIAGPAVAVLTGERTALNFLQRMSGIATTTRAFVDRVAGTGVMILDTRKTAPGLRVLDKMAVRAGGGHNHRMGLFDMILVKDNHIDACGSLTDAVARAREGDGPRLPLEVECRTLAHVREVLPLGADRLLLDNMSVEQVRACVEAVAGRVPLEVSGNVTLENVRDYALTGVARISVGALTHSVRALDLSLVVS